MTMLDYLMSGEEPLSREKALDLCYMERINPNRSYESWAAEEATYEQMARWENSTEINPLDYGFRPEFKGKTMLEFYMGSRGLSEADARVACVKDGITPSRIYDEWFEEWLINFLGF